MSNKTVPTPKNIVQRFHPENTIPNGNWIWVFASSQGGKHKKGDAKIAHVNFRAEYGVDSGRTAKAYAINCFDKHDNYLSDEAILKSVNIFLDYAQNNPKLSFFITRIGFNNELLESNISKLFLQSNCNCSLPAMWDIK